MCKCCLQCCLIAFTTWIHAVFDLQTEKGSALHEAALFGKTDVVQILLAAGENLSAKIMYQLYCDL